MSMSKTRVCVAIFFALVLGGIGGYFLAKHLTDRHNVTMEYFPKGENSMSSLIWINRFDELNSSYWADQLGDFIKEYSDTSNWEGNGQLCTFTNDKVATEDEYCIVQVGHMEQYLLPEYTNFGYTERVGKAAIVLKSKPIEGWVPEPYELEDLERADVLMMPDSLQNMIRNLSADHTPYLTKRMLNTIWISCDGATPADKENMGQIRFFVPGMGSQDFPGIPNYYFPYLNQSGYETPFVIVQFQNLRVNLLINVECRAWAKNIGPVERKGFISVQFELLID